jgi:hypothetical protein
MKRGKLLSALLVAAALAVPGNFALAEKAAVPAASAEQAVSVEAPAGPGRLYESQGLKLRIPEAYDELLLKDTTAQEGSFFAVSEKASVEAAQKAGETESGAGWIFSLGRLTAEQLHEKLRHDMSGAELIAKDSEGGYYIYYHPTDVRYVRESQEAMKRDQEQWLKLNAWGWDYAHGDFIKDNNLTPVTADNSNIGIHLARFIYGPAEAYTLCKNEEVPVLADAGFSPLPYVEKLLYGASYRGTTGMQLRKFKYYTLVLPREGVQLDFFTGKDGESYVQEMHEGKTNYQYRITFEDKNVKAYDVMTKWLSDLKAYHEKAGKAATFEAASSWDKKK